MRLYVVEEDEAGIGWLVVQGMASITRQEAREDLAGRRAYRMDAFGETAREARQRTRIGVFERTGSAR